MSLIAVHQRLRVTLRRKEISRSLVNFSFPKFLVIQVLARNLLREGFPPLCLVASAVLYCSAAEVDRPTFRLPKIQRHATLSEPTPDMTMQSLALPISNKSFTRKTRSQSQLPGRNSCLSTQTRRPLHHRVTRSAGVGKEVVACSRGGGRNLAGERSRGSVRSPGRRNAPFTWKRHGSSEHRHR